MAKQDMSLQVSERINQALNMIPSIPKEYGRISAAAQLFGESHQTVRLWLASGESKKVGMPDIRKIPHVSKILDINIEWLLTGEGQMRPDSQTKATIDKEIGGQTVRFINEKLFRSGYFDLAIHKQDSVFGLIYETLKAKDGDISDDFETFIVTTIDAFK